MRSPAVGAEVAVCILILVVTRHDGDGCENFVLQQGAESLEEFLVVDRGASDSPPGVKASVQLDLTLLLGFGGARQSRGRFTPYKAV